MNRKPPFRFNIQKDILLLREVVAISPIDKPTRWTEVASNLNMGIDARRCREHTTLLLEQFRKDDKAALRKSGTEEEFTERDQLLQEMVEKEEERKLAKPVVKSEKKKMEDSKKAGEDVRKAAMQARKDENEEGSPKPKKRKGDVFEYLREKNTQEFNIKQKELDLKQREIQLQEERFQLEKKEREAMINLLRDLKKS